MTPQQRTAFITALVLGLAYIALIPQQPWPLSWALKPLPMLIYAALMWRVFVGATGRWLALGYVAAALGDFFLDYGERDGLFMQALLAFLVNQIALIVAFARLGAGRPMPWLRALPALLYCVLLAAWLVPRSGHLMLPVAVYLGSLLAMAVMACRVEARIGPVWLGAMLFLLADSLIGVNKFATPFPHAVLVIVCCYFTGQSLIAWGLLRVARPARS
ncbi:MAG: lysoplasmalogenase [Gammaproteobacteria bacterium]|nr:lysoplasmalogenase [Gammaproteobacteria bacterium]